MYPTTIGAALFLATAALLLGDYQWNLLGAVPARALAKTAEKLGSLALVSGAAAFGLYILRLLLVWAAKNGGLLPPSFQALLQSGGKLLRAWHPLIGALAVSLAAFHSYVLFFARPTDPPAIYSGLPLLGAALLLAGAGWYLRAAPASLAARKAHRYLAFAALVLILLHLALAD